jgi:hypothetical protein
VGHTRQAASLTLCLASGARQYDHLSRTNEQCSAYVLVKTCSISDYHYTPVGTKQETWFIERPCSS